MKSAIDTRANDLDQHDELLWSIKTVVLKTGLSTASIYRYAARNLLPARRRIGSNRVAWLASEVVAWVESRPPPDQRRPTPRTRRDQVAGYRR